MRVWPRERAQLPPSHTFSRLPNFPPIQLNFDFRIAGFADLDGLYISFGQQAEQYFNLIADMKGCEDFEKEARSFEVTLKMTVRLVSKTMPILYGIESRKD